MALYPSFRDAHMETEPHGNDDCVSKATNKTARDDMYALESGNDVFSQSDCVSIITLIEREHTS
jgi:hypothetical protein